MGAHRIPAGPVHTRDFFLIGNFAHFKFSFYSSSERRFVFPLLRTKQSFQSLTYRKEDFTLKTEVFLKDFQMRDFQVYIFSFLAFLLCVLFLSYTEKRPNMLQNHLLNKEEDHKP